MWRTAKRALLLVDEARLGARLDRMDADRRAGIDVDRDTTTRSIGAGSRLLISDST
jgi:hypothetical protein